jgi:purine-nucleoside phosphorylase
LSGEVNNPESLVAAIDRVRQVWSCSPRFAVILGTGLGAFVDGMTIEASIPYEELPGFCQSTAIGHAGEFICGRIDSIPVVALRGRSHCYEGVSREQIAYPIKVLKQLGIETLIVSCAAGGLSPTLQLGEMMVIEDQIDFQFPAKASHRSSQSKQHNALFDQDYQSKILDIGRSLDLSLRTGTYISVTGPNYETRAEMRFYRTLGDAIGMSTVPEVIQAKQLGMRVLGLATITNLCNPDALVGADGDHVVCVASETEPDFRKLVIEFIRDEAKQ